MWTCWCQYLHRYLFLHNFFFRFRQWSGRKVQNKILVSDNVLVFYINLGCELKNISLINIYFFFGVRCGHLGRLPWAPVQGEHRHLRHPVVGLVALPWARLAFLPAHLLLLHLAWVLHRHW